MNWWTAWLNKKVQERTLQYLPVLREKGPAVREVSPRDLLAQKDSMFHRMAQLQAASAEWSI